MQGLERCPPLLHPLASSKASSKKSGYQQATGTLLRPPCLTPYNPRSTLPMSILPLSTPTSDLPCSFSLCQLSPHSLPHIHLHVQFPTSTPPHLFPHICSPHVHFPTSALLMFIPPHPVSPCLLPYIYLSYIQAPVSVSCSLCLPLSSLSHPLPLTYSTFPPFLLDYNCFSPQPSPMGQKKSCSPSPAMGLRKGLITVVNGPEEEAGQVAQRKAGSWKQLWDPPPHLPPDCNQSDWIRGQGNPNHLRGHPSFAVESMGLAPN